MKYKELIQSAIDNAKVCTYCSIHNREILTKTLGKQLGRLVSGCIESGYMNKNSHALYYNGFTIHPFKPMAINDLTKQTIDLNYNESFVIEDILNQLDKINIFSS